LLLVPVFPQFNPETEKAVPALFLKDTAENQSSEHPVELVALQIWALAQLSHPPKIKRHAINGNFVVFLCINIPFKSKITNIFHHCKVDKTNK
jgi:hypothetical protein